jgi:hypothetical protein
VRINRRAVHQRHRHHRRPTSRTTTIACPIPRRERFIWRQDESARFFAANAYEENEGEKSADRKARRAWLLEPIHLSSITGSARVALSTPPIPMLQIQSGPFPAIRSQHAAHSSYQIHPGHQLHLRGVHLSQKATTDLLSTQSGAGSEPEPNLGPVPSLARLSKSK